MTGVPTTEFSHATVNDFIRMMVGDLIGRGMYREVYAAACDGEHVFKIELREQYFSNVHEWEIWKAATPEVKKWLAPCADISPCGHVLVQKRVNPVRRLPKSVPNFLTDIKLSNWGEYNGRIVCCDYGNHKLFTDGLWKTRLRTLKPNERGAR